MKMFYCREKGEKDWEEVEAESPVMAAEEYAADFICEEVRIIQVRSYGTYRCCPVYVEYEATKI